MLFSITATGPNATELGFLLHKHPDKVQSFSFSAGKAHVFYPKNEANECTAALLLDIDPVGLVRKGDKGGEGFSLRQYVNDRPYVASSFMSVAIAQVYTSALSGKCANRPELVDKIFNLKAKLSVLPSRGGKHLIEKLFQPLGYQINIKEYQLDEQFPEWGKSPYYTVTLQHEVAVKDLLSHIYVLIPVLDNDKHYFIGQHEMEKLIEKGGEWLKSHPEKEFITRRYLKNLGSLSRQALTRLLETEASAEEISDEPGEEKQTKEYKNLHEHRLQVVYETLKNLEVKRVLDLGCGEGKLLLKFMKDKQFTEILGMDVSYRAIEHAIERLKYDEWPERQKLRLKLIQGSLMYRDKRLSGFEGAAVVEVIEHLDVPRLKAFERVLFEFAKPGVAVITTPNGEYNAKFEKPSAGEFRHKDHRFEWTREEFSAWANNICEKYGYNVELSPLGNIDEQYGAPSQMAVFKLN